MLETVDLNAEVDKATYKEALKELDLRLGALQRDLRADGTPVLVVFEGWDTAGKGSTLSRLLQALDPRGFKVHTIAPTTDLEEMRPPMRRFWLTLPSNGTIAIYDRSWYRQVIEERVDNDLSAKKCGPAFERIRTFERQLADAGTVIIKFFLHISKKEQAKRFDKLSEDPAFSWKVGKAERRQHKNYDEHTEAVEDMLRETSMPYAPWTIVPATDQRLATLTVAEKLVSAFEHARVPQQVAASVDVSTPPRRTSPLDEIDLTLQIDRDVYSKQLPKLQDEMRRLQHLCYVQRKPVVIVYEGCDAAGKGGNIRRLARELDPRGYEVVPVAAPQGEEKTHHYLWRFWRALPKAGHIAIFDRSWYGRVLVERVEGFAAPPEWARAYTEINEFESQLAGYGMVVVKFWLQISKEEQLKRFEQRQELEHKRWKITDEDWRNREKWDAYREATSDMLERTSTSHAPWTIVDGDDKRHARIKTLETVTKRLAKALNGKK